MGGERATAAIRPETLDQRVTPFQSAHDLAERDRIGRSSEGKTAAGAPAGGDEAVRTEALQTAIVSTPGELGTIANLEQHTRRESHFLDAHDAALTQALGKDLPVETAPSQDYTGPARLIVPTIRTTTTKGEVLTLRIIALDSRPADSLTVHLRLLGEGPWQSIPAMPRGRAVFEVRLPSAQRDFEYYISSTRDLVWPPTAPRLNQTVVVRDEG